MAVRRSRAVGRLTLGLLAALVSTGLSEEALGCHPGEAPEAPKADDDNLCALQTLRRQTKLDSNETSEHQRRSGTLSEESDPADSFEVGCEAALNLITGGAGMAQSTTFDVDSATSILEGIGGIVGIAVPPPAGVIAGTFISFAGGIMSLFGGGQPEPSNQDVLDAMQEGFDQVQEKLAEIDVKLDNLEEEVLEILDLLVKYDTLQYNDIEHIHQASETLLKLQALASGSELGMHNYIAQARNYRLMYESEMATGGAVSPANVVATMSSLKDDCDAGDFYKEILAARVQLYHIVSTDNWFQAAEVIADEAQRMADRGTHAMATLQDLYSDLKAFGDAVSARGPEALWRWEVGQGTTCTEAMVGPNTLISTPRVYDPPEDGDGTLCIHSAEEGKEVMAGLCWITQEQWPFGPPDAQPITEYDGRATFVDTWSGVVSNNPGGRFDDLPFLCMTSTGVVDEEYGYAKASWASCSDIPDDERFKVEGGTKEPFVIRNKYGCLFMPQEISGLDWLGSFAFVGDCDVDNKQWQLLAWTPEGAPTAPSLGARGAAQTKRP